jgi:hypothetical protein
MPLAHVQSFISQNLLFASGFSRTPIRPPVSGYSSSGTRRHLPPSSALRRTHRGTAWNQQPASALLGTPWSTADRPATLRQAPKSCPGCGVTASGLVRTPHLTSFARQSSEEPISEAPERHMQSSVEPDAHRQHTTRLRRATGYCRVARRLMNLSDHCRPKLLRSGERKSESRQVSSRLTRTSGCGRKASPGSEELGEFSLEQGEVQVEPHRQPETRFQAPKSSGGCRRSAQRLGEPSHRQ